MNQNLSMPHKKEIVVKEWMDFAKEDLDTAGLILNGDYLYNRSICYHCQQAAEKYLKAYILFSDLPIIKTHNIALLCEQIQDIDKDILQIYDTASELTQYITAARYPDDFEKLCDEDSREAYKISFKVAEFVISKIRF